MSAETAYSVFGLKYIFLRVGGIEVPLQAAQDATLTLKQTMVEMFGDDAILPLDIQPKRLEVNVKGKQGQMALASVNAMLGGTETAYGSGAFTTPMEENGGCQMVNAMGTPVISNASALLTDGWSFGAISSTQYTITQSSTGLVIGTFTVGYPNTAIPGITISVTGTLVTGAWASFQTTSSTGTLETNFLKKSDFPSQLALRCISEGPTGGSQTEIFIPKAQPAGITIPFKTKDFAYIDFEFHALFDSNSAKTISIRKYDRPVVTC